MTTQKALQVLVLFISLLFAAQSSALTYLWQGASLDHLLTPSAADSLRIEGLAPHLEVVDGRQVLLLTRDGRLFDLTRRIPLPLKETPRVNAFACSAGLLVVIRNDTLGWVEDGRIQEQFVLPLKGMGVMAGTGERIYLYGSHDGGSRIYLLEKGKVLFLLEIPRGTISAFTTIGERIFFAVDNVIYTLTRGEKPGILFIAAGEKGVRSLACDPLAGMLYFSAGEAVYAMRAGVAITILRGLKGILRYSGKALFVLDPERRRLVKIQGLEKLTVDSGQSGTPISPKDFKE